MEKESDRSLHQTDLPPLLPEGEERAAEGVGPYNGVAGEAGATEAVGSCDGVTAPEESGTGFVQQKCPGGCIYRGKVSGTSCCNYIFITGKSRGCPPGRDCKHYKRGAVLRCLEE